MITLDLFRGRTYAEARQAFRWQVPERYNIGVHACNQWAARDPGRLALLCAAEDGVTLAYTYADLRDLSNRCANGLAALGVGRGDRVAIVLNQRVETAAAHLACYKMAAVAVPMTRKFGPDALAYRLQNSGSKVAIVDPAVVPVLSQLHDQLPELRAVVVAESGGAADLPGEAVAGCRYLTWGSLIGAASAHYIPADTTPDDAALLVYTSGTTGPPKGALHGHRVLLGHIPSTQMCYDFVPQPDQVFWTPADWAWMGGSYDLLFPGLAFGGPVVAYDGAKFDPERAFHIMARHGVTHAFLPPTSLKMMMQVERPSSRYHLAIRAIMSGGEAVNPPILEWMAREMPDAVINEIYGQTEANLLCGNSSRVFPIRPGSFGRAYPGHDVQLIKEDGSLAAPGEVGEVAVRGPGDPVVFKGYWQNEQATRAKYHGDWVLTGDLARQDEEGYFYFEGRKDDVINSAGYRIGPSEVESALLSHPAVAEAAAIGVPDALRGEIVKGFVKLRPGYAPSEALKAEIQGHVRARLAAYAYPRELEFIAELPMTTTGKIRRAELRAREAARRRS